MDPVDFSILTPNGMLGYGYDLQHFWYGVVNYRPKAIIVDSGSTDGGPYKLGMNKMTCGRNSYVRDLKPILEACYYYKIKVLISSVGGDGSNSHVEEMLSIVTELANANKYSFNIATINIDISRNLIKSRIEEGKCSPCGPVPDLNPRGVDAAVDVVAQMGAEPYLKALESDPDIILGGRSYDPAPFAAFSMYHGVSPGAAWHMGKIMECGGICAVPKGRSMIATMHSSSFELVPLNPIERCTPLSVAAHTLYEKTRPDRLPGPGGILNLDQATYTQLEDNRTVRVQGAEFEPSSVYQVKLEGVELLGYRTIFIGGIRDPILISQIDEFLESVKQYTQKLFPELDQSENCHVTWHIYGRNAVMGPLEPAPNYGNEIGVLGEVLAETPELSHAIANNFRVSILHMPYKGQLATTGNFASPLSPHEQSAGACFKFSLYHLIDLKPGEEETLFPISIHKIQNSLKTPEKHEPLSQSDLEALNCLKPSPIVLKRVADGVIPMKDIANVIRSKNSGPFELTLDIMFDSAENFNRVRKANLLTNETIKNLYRVTDSDIITNMYYEPALAWKCTLKRPWAQGSFGERDTLGTQQHAPLLDISVPSVSKTRLLNGSSIPVPDKTFTACSDKVETKLQNGIATVVA